MTWKQIAAEKKSHQLDSVPKEWLSADLPPSEALSVIDFPGESHALSTLDVEITESSVASLLSNLASSKWSAVQVTTSFYKRAIVAQELVSFFLIGKADSPNFTDFRALDEHLQKTGQVVGALHGLPISLKDQISIKGIESTMGYVSWVGQFAEKNSVLVDILESLGAVPFVKTNICQTLMWTETFNHVFGRTTNPYNRSLTSGGSSGGEGALVALKGSPLGVGSDIGGSVRIPAGFCGVYGLRPSYNRIPYAGCVNSLEGEDSILSVLGPLSNTLDGIKTFFKAVLSKEPWQMDPMVIRKRWSEEEYRLIDHGNGEKLCFAIMWDNGVVVPHPPVRRGLEITKKALLAAGHQVIDWKPYKHAEIWKNFNRSRVSAPAIPNFENAIWNAASAEDFKVSTAPTGEPVIASMGLLQDELLSRLSPIGISAFELWKLHKIKRDLRQEYLKHWEETVSQTGTGRPVDAIISPMAPYTAPPHGMNKTAQYTMWCNLLDYPAMIIPVTKVDQALDVKQPRQQFYNVDDRENYERYDPATHENAPVSIQIVGRTMEEEAVIAMSEIVDKALRGAKSKL
ncbi:Amidase domain-containing protein [Mycena venus]|uniref:amidase n=1 Tax=Mycena venus TaxID=2733690 RepID=A0A8H7CRL4_9AGAR|nr:Amidase domain-containing protein [Mycena venus]